MEVEDVQRREEIAGKLNQIYKQDQKLEEQQKKIESIDDHIVAKYEIVAKVGKGAYGVVWKAIDKRSKKLVAIKKIFDAFANDVDSQRTFREAYFLLEMGFHPNIIQI